MEETVIQKCQRCLYRWVYRGKKRSRKFPIYTSCPQCRTMVKIKFIKEKEVNKNG